MTSSWDQASYLLSLGSMKAMAPKLLTLFISGLEQKVALLNDALLQNDAKIMAQQAHAIKGSSAQVQCRQLSQYAAQLEQSLELHGIGHSSELTRMISEQAQFDIAVILEYMHTIT